MYKEVDIEHYLLRCLKFKMIDYFRQSSHQQRLQNVISTRQQQYPNYTEDHIVYLDTKKQLYRHTADLPAQCRRVFLMSRDQLLSNKNIATSLAISERAVAYHISSALSFLRKKGMAEFVES